MRTCATAKTVENPTGIEQYDIAELEKGARSEISKNISNMLMMQKSEDNKCKRGGEHMKEREKKRRERTWKKKERQRWNLKKKEGAG